MSFLIVWAIIGIIFFVCGLVDHHKEMAGLPWWAIFLGVWITFLIYLLAWPWPVWHDYNIKQREENDYDTV